MRTPEPDDTAIRRATPRRSRRFVLLGAGTLTIVLAISGIVSAMASGSPHATSLTAPAMVVAVTPSGLVASTPAAPQQSSSGQAAVIPVTSLADGTYPAYVRHVDTAGAAITVDVVQLFEDQAAVDAAIEDGTSPADAQYLYVYIRDQNSLLRTFPVAPDVRIQFVGECEAPANLDAALTELAEATTPFTDTYYYAITVRDGVIHQVTQHLAIPAC
jgi:hypothetical protein